MNGQNILTTIQNINERTPSSTINYLYDEIFKQIANNHSGVYFDDKIWVIDELVDIYHQPNKI